jgi:hypothetical protein
MAQTSKEGFYSISSQAWRGESSWAATANVEKQALALSSSPWVNKTKSTKIKVVNIITETSSVDRLRSTHKVPINM